MTIRNPLLSAMVSLLALTASVAGAAAQTVSVNESPNGLVLKSQTDEVSLRGYGKVSSKRWMDGKDGSIFQITCESEDKAKLTLAKYLSDLQLLPAVQKAALPVAAPGVAGSVYVIKDQGAITALRAGNEVDILAAPTPEGVADLFSQGLTGDKGKVVFSPEMEVPMWLDRWDKYSFRFCYYRSGNTPKGKTVADYDVFQEIDYAEKMDHSGLINITRLDEDNTAEGLNSNPLWDWAVDAAAAKKIPYGINLQGYEWPSIWLANRYRNQLEQGAPEYCGTHFSPLEGDGHHVMAGFISNCATTVAEVTDAMKQQLLRDECGQHNVVTILGVPEMSFVGNIFADYGPGADASYRAFLQVKYQDPSKLSAAWGTNVTSWEAIKVPELAEFLGWGSQALDLQGEWRMGYEKFAAGTSPTPDDLAILKFVPTEEAPAEWYQPQFDDSAWPTVTAPGDDIAFFLPKRPAVYRRTYEVPQAWLSRNPRVWLYVWDLNMEGGNVRVVVNGKVVGDGPCRHNVPHWGAYEVTDVLHAGSNQFSLRLPNGALGYRVYLSPDEPKQYPNLGVGRNAQWVDFISWQKWTRLNSVRKSVQAIRQVEPNTQLDLKSPTFYIDDVKQLAVEYGGNFKNTGYMQAFWMDDLPAMMRGARLPFSLETAGPDKDAVGFERTMGLYATEGIQAVDYFLSLGDIYWHPDIRQKFEETFPLIRMIGKYHVPTAEVAALNSNLSIQLNAYPWGEDYNTNLGSGQWNWNSRAGLIGTYESDLVTESSFASGDAARYKVILDTNTSVMDEAMVSAIEKYVRDGGTFVTFVQTGRHTPTQKDAWPISRLTGYQVTQIDQLIPDKNPTNIHWIPARTRTLKPAPGQDVFKDSWMQTPANGLSLKKVADDARDLVLWNDGSTAIGIRPLGKGYIVDVGCKFVGSRMEDRIEGEPTPDMAAVTEMFSEVLQWRGIAPVGISFAKEDGNFFVRHYISNNGLYDVWAVRDRSEKEPVDNVLTLPAGTTATWAWDVQAGGPIALDQAKIAIKFAPLQYNVYLVPRNQIAQAPEEWFNLQCGWWQGAQGPLGDPLPPPPHEFSVDLSRDWAFKPLKDGEDVTPYLQAGVDDSSWDKVRMGFWSGKYRDVRHAVIRKTFMVPAEWTDGQATLWFTSIRKKVFGDNEGSVWLDGKLIYTADNIGIKNANPDNTLKPGSTHTLVMEVQGKGYSLLGTGANAWLWYWMNPLQSIDLKGPWLPSNDLLTFDAPIAIPGTYTSGALKRTVTVPADQAGNTAVIDLQVEGTNQRGTGIIGVLINGHYTRGASSELSLRMGNEHLQLNVTPWVKYGGENELTLVSYGLRPGGTVHSVTMNFYKPGVYP